MPDFTPGALSKARGVDMTAVLSGDRIYRFELRRVVSESNLGTVCWIMLNPSTADETEDDPTIRRCIDFTRRWGYRDLVVVNVWPFRSTDPKGLQRWLRGWDSGQLAVGIRNWNHVRTVALASDYVVAAWGTHGQRERGPILVKMLMDAGVALHTVRVTPRGAPGHPLYVPKIALPEPWMETS